MQKVLICISISNQRLVKNLHNENAIIHTPVKADTWPIRMSVPFSFPILYEQSQVGFFLFVFSH